MPSQHQHGDNLLQGTCWKEAGPLSVRQVCSFLGNNVLKRRHPESSSGQQPPPRSWKGLALAEGYISTTASVHGASLMEVSPLPSQNHPVFVPAPLQSTSAFKNGM